MSVITRAIAERAVPRQPRAVATEERAAERPQGGMLGPEPPPGSGQRRADPPLPAAPAGEFSYDAAALAADVPSTDLDQALRDNPNLEVVRSPSGTTTLFEPAVDGLKRGVRYGAGGERLGAVRATTNTH